MVYYFVVKCSIYCLAQLFEDVLKVLANRLTICNVIKHFFLTEPNSKKNFLFAFTSHIMALFTSNHLVQFHIFPLSCCFFRCINFLLLIVINEENVQTAVAHYICHVQAGYWSIIADGYVFVCLFLVIRKVLASMNRLKGSFFLLKVFWQNSDNLSL